MRNEIFLVSALYAHAVAAPPPEPPASAPWGLKNLENPVRQVSLPPPRPHRDRRLQDADFPGEQGERDRMREALRSGPEGAVMDAFFTLAIETGMRLSELLGITISQIRSEGGVWIVRLDDTKNGHGRKVTLSSRATAAVQVLRSGRAKDQKLVTVRSGQMRYRWDRARRVSGVTGLHFHDLRHEGLSLMAQAGLDIGQLQSQSGHRTPGILLTYVNSRPSEVAKKLG